MNNELYCVRFNVDRSYGVYRNFYMMVEVDAHNPANAVLTALKYLGECGFALDRIQDISYAMPVRNLVVKSGN